MEARAKTSDNRPATAGGGAIQGQRNEDKEEPSSANTVSGIIIIYQYEPQTGIEILPAKQQARKNDIFDNSFPMYVCVLLTSLNVLPGVRRVIPSESPQTII